MASVASREFIEVQKSPVPAVIPVNVKKGPKQRDAERKQRFQLFRTEQKYLDTKETDEFRNSYFQNLCTNVLADGFHRSFTELFHLICQQRQDREEAGPESNLWQQTPLEHEHEKLRTLARFLTVAESSLRKDEYLAAYEAYLQLAQYFEVDAHDKWLSDHFFDVCLKAAEKVTSDDGRKYAESHFNKGVSLEKSGLLEEAAEFFKLFYNLTENKDVWYGSDNKLLHTIACENWSRVNIMISEKVVETGDHQRVISILQQAHAIAKESRNKKLEAKCSYNLGLAFNRLDKLQVALPFLKQFYELAKEIDDSEDLGLACEALAKAYEKQGNMDTSIKFLTEFASATEGKQEKLFSRACRGLGAVFNNQRDYAKAAEYFNKAFSVARSLNDREDIYLTRTQYGISSAFSFINKYNTQLQIATKSAMNHLHEWKDMRKGDNVKKDLEDKSVCSLASRKPTNRKPPTVTNNTFDSLTIEAEGSTNQNTEQEKQPATHSEMSKSKPQSAKSEAAASNKS